MAAVRIQVDPLGCTAGIEFPVVKLLDFDDAALEHDANKKLLPRIRRIDDADTLLALHRALSTADNIDDFRRALP
ncbi:MAG: hypothetical protein L0Y71_00790 [Gemmataceae bacterium]|nr:hypothetical protein [Gemmataceae bacterium]